MHADKVTPIAIIGMNMKFPAEAVSPQAFWEMLLSGRCAAKEVPPSRYNLDAFYHPDPARLDSTRVRKAHFMDEDPRAFDAPFFNMSPAEASILDPLQRGLLEGSYRAFENAGIPMECLVRSPTSVFCASFGRDGEAIQSRDPEHQSRYGVTSFGSAMLSNRISHFFDLSGPSLTVDTACSGGLYALHLACQSLIQGESRLSLVCGGNTLMAPESQTVPLSNADFLSPDGHCYSFDHRANGYSRGEGFGFVVLKPLVEALKDGDVIRAVIRATGANQDGRTPSITQPSTQAQIDLFRSTYSRAGLSLAETDYVEAHGTGTKVGDPLEAAAIGTAFGEHREEERPIWVGSAKSNIGHLEGASGLASVIKTVLALENGIVPPISNLEKPNQVIDLVRSRLRFPKDPVPWPTAAVRRASVSNFGYGGSNAHVILDDAYNYLRTRGLQGNHVSVANGNHSGGSTKGYMNGHTNGHDTDGVNGCVDGPGTYPAPHIPFAIIPLSAADEDGTRRQAETLHEFLKGLPSEKKTTDYLSDLAYTLSARRSLLSYRSFSIFSLASDMTIDVQQEMTPSTWSVPSRTPELSFVFTGQGAQYARMAWGLRSYQMFNQSLEDCDVYLKSLGCRRSVLEELARHKDKSRIDEPVLSQTLCTAIQVGMVDLLRAWNIVPSAVCGHSSGEIAAAYCADAITRESAWSIAYFRGIISSKLSSDSSRAPTTMMSVGLSVKAVEPLLLDEPSVSVACVNSPTNVTLSGPTDSISRMLQRLERQETFVKKLSVKIGYHSNALLDGAAEYAALIKGIQGPLYTDKKSAVTAFYSSARGTFLSLGCLRDPAYWVGNLLGPVKFCDAVTAMIGDKKRARHFLVEIGPQAALRRPVKDILTPLIGTEGDKWRYACVLHRAQDDVLSALQVVGQLWSSPMPIDLTGPNRASIRSKRPPRVLADLPAYPFSRAKEYWEESRISRKFSSRPYRRHALLGLREADWNAHEPVWKHQIRFAENPWILDHGLNGSPIYPGAGMLVMAIEAIRQLLADSEHRISGYKLENVRFIRAIAVNDSEHGTDVKIHLHAHGRGGDNHVQVWYDWRVFTPSGDEWTECANGSVKVELESERTAATNARRDRLSKAINGQYEEIARRCSLGVYHSQFYNNLSQRSGFEYKTYFQPLRNITYDRSGHASATLGLRDYVQTMPYADEDPCVIHPTTLDAITHLMMAALSQGGWQPIRTMMLTHVQEMWISNKLFNVPGNPQLHVALKETSRTFREVDVSSVVILEESKEPVMFAKGQRGTAIISRANPSLSGGDTDEANRMSYCVDYQPDLSLLDAKETHDYLMDSFIKDPQCLAPSNEYVDRADAIALHFVEQALERIDIDGPKEFDTHFAKYVQWMRRMHENREKLTLESRGLGHLKIRDVLRQADSEPTQRLTKKAGEHLFQILNGTESALQVIFQGNLAEEFYHSDLFSLHYRKMGKYIRLLAHVNPQLRILEVGAGTGSSTRHILPYLVDRDGSGDDNMVFAEYAYTDVSPGFFEKAKQHFAYAESHMRFAKLDLEDDPCDQGFSEASYDVIVAGNVLHATKDILQTLRHVQKLLKPGGKLIIGENTNMEYNARDSVIFGLLPGWWMREGHWSSEAQYADQGPLLTIPEWHTVLQEVDFPGVEMAFKDYEKTVHNRGSVMVTTAPVKDAAKYGEKKSSPREKWIILVDRKSDTQLQFAIALKLAFGGLQGVEEPDVIHVEACDTIGNHLNENKIISLLELDQSLFGDIGESQFATVKRISLESRLVLWITSGGITRASNPAAEVAVGFGRSICSERGGQNFVNLVLGNEPLPTGVDYILRLLKNKFLVNRDIHDESEYSVRDGMIQVPRLLPHKGFNHAIAIRSKQPENVTYTLGQEGLKPNINLVMEMPGLLESFYYTENALGEDLMKGEVEVEVKAVSLNFRDVMIALGQVTGDAFGWDVAGIVSRCGPGSQFQPGDGVMSLKAASEGTGTLGTYARCLEKSTARIPKGQSFHAAATLPVAWCTVVYAFDFLARLRAGQTVLIHSGAGGVGQAAIQLAKLRGAEVFVTVGSSMKRQLLKELYGLSDDHIFSSREESFVDDILHATGGRGVDVLVNSLSGDLLQQSFGCVAPLGHFINLTESDVLANNALSMRPFDRNVTFTALNLPAVYEEDQNLTGQILRQVACLFEENPGLQASSPLSIFSPSKIEEPMRALQGGKIAGKVVLDFTRAGDALNYRPMAKPAYEFAENATYAISGGLGGLGREIVHWMISRGARNFILFSSRGASGRPDAEIFLHGVRQKGAVVLAPKCDISNRESLRDLLKDVHESMPPIRGCIQCAMVLDDDMLSNMTVSQFHRALRPKYAGSWNLHDLLPRNMDFMIFLSSLCGIVGNPAQANYAAGNTYQDALARCRVMSGQKAVAIDLGLVAEAGWANVNYENVAMRQGLGNGITTAQLMNMLDVLCDPSYDCTGDNGTAAQIVNLAGRPSELYRMFQDGYNQWLNKPLLSHLMRTGEAELMTKRAESKDEKQQFVDYVALVKAATDAEQAAEVVLQALVEKLSKSLSVPAEGIDVGKPAFAVGVDSLIAVEVRYWFLKQFGTEVPVLNILKNQSMTELCRQVAALVL
ncbi:polyketide synthase PksG, partial [Diaporthe sp. PMI_573]